MACIALTARWEQMVKLVVALTERFARVLDALAAAAVEEEEGVTEAEGMVEATTEAEAIQLLRTQVSLIHHLIVFLLPDRITAAKPTPRPTVSSYLTLVSTSYLASPRMSLPDLRLRHCAFRTVFLLVLLVLSPHWSQVGERARAIACLVAYCHFT